MTPLLVFLAISFLISIILSLSICLLARFRLLDILKPSIISFDDTYIVILFAPAAARCVGRNSVYNALSQFANQRVELG